MDKDILITTLLDRVQRCEDVIEKLRAEFREVKAENTLLRQENERLKQEIERLKEKLILKNSRNSSKPPSTEIHPPKRTQSLRKSSGRKPGGQAGHKGSTLEMVADPDVIDKRIPDYCNGCGSTLSSAKKVFVGRRQLIDLPPIVPVVTEQQLFECTCSCGHTTQGQYSGNANAAVGYGENIESVVAYLHARQYLPVARMSELFNDILGISISTGGISHLIERFAGKTTPAYELIKAAVQGSAFVGSDETGCKVNGKLHWFWTWQSPHATYIAHSASRGKKAVDENFPQGFPQAIMGHDAWLPQLNTPAKGRQLCVAHMLRELEHLMELYAKDPWSKGFADLLRKALKLKYSMDDQKTVCPAPDKHLILARFTELLAEPPDPKSKKAVAFYRRIQKNKDHIFTFLDHHGVPPDNNSSERAIRNIKVKQKVSGQFKAAQSAINFAKIRSVIDTTSRTYRMCWQRSRSSSAMIRLWSLPNLVL